MKALYALVCLLVMGVVVCFVCGIDMLLKKAPPSRVLKDPACHEYIAVPGEPCRGDRYLWAGGEQPRAPLCLCVTVPGKTP